MEDTQNLEDQKIEPEYELFSDDLNHVFDIAFTVFDGFPHDLSPKLQKKTLKLAGKLGHDEFVSILILLLPLRLRETAATTWRKQKK